MQTITLSSLGPMLNSSTVLLNSGFRLRFNGAVTYSTQVGGAPGCITAAFSASDLRAELLTLPTIDDVMVSRVITTDMLSVIYSITFSGALVRGSVPLITSEDQGLNGCNTNFLTPASIQQVRQSVLPVYRLEKTPPLPVNCTANELKVALESLPLVTRVVCHQPQSYRGLRLMRCCNRRSADRWQAMDSPGS